MISGDDWMAQAKRDLEGAKWAIQEGYYELYSNPLSRQRERRRAL